MLFTFFHFILGDSLSYSFLFQNIYFNDTTSSINHIFIKNFTGNILQLVISNLLFPLQRYCLDFSADFTKIQTYFYKALMYIYYTVHIMQLITILFQTTLRKYRPLKVIKTI